MSFVISKTQHLAPKEEKANYSPWVVKVKDSIATNINVAFGHPLYDSVVEIYYFRMGNERVVPVIPDGCVTLVFAIKNNECEGYLCGVLYEIKKLTLTEDTLYLVFKLSPGVGHSLLNQNLSEVANQCIRLNGKYEWADEVCDILMKDKDFNEKITSASRVIRSEILEDNNKYIIRYCTNRIIEAKGKLKIEILSEETGFTSRYIGKQFEKYVGASPKLFSQILKLQTTLRRMDEDKTSLLVNIALDCGFFDHAHMNRMYKKLLHCSSGEIRSNGFSEMDLDSLDEYLKEESR